MNQNDDVTRSVFKGVLGAVAVIVAVVVIGAVVFFGFMRSGPSVEEQYSEISSGLG